MKTLSTPIEGPWTPEDDPLPPVGRALSPVDDFIRIGDGYIDVLCPRAGWNVEDQLDYDHDTMYGCFARNAATIGDHAFLGTRQWDERARRYTHYTWESYAECMRTVEALAGGLAALGLRKGDRACLFSDNCAYWVLAEYAVLRQGGVTVPLYATLGRGAIAHILAQTEAQLCVVAPPLVKDLLAAVAGAADSGAAVALRTVVLMPRTPGKDMHAPLLSAELRARAEALGLAVREWDAVLAAGAAQPCAATPSAPDELHSIVYTSGTLGRPKGVMLTNRAWTVTSDKVPAHPCFGPGGYHEEVHFSYLPLAHVYERAFFCVIVRRGCCAGFTSGSTARIMDDVQQLHPTYLLGVPRVWKRIYDKVTQTIETGGFFQRFLFNQAYAAAARADMAGRSSSSTSGNSGGGGACCNWDRLVLDKIKMKLGGACRTFVSGAAPISSDLAAWLARVFEVEVAQIYGLTECSGGAISSIRQLSEVAAAAAHDRTRVHSPAGYPCPFGIVRLVDVPELGYSVALSAQNPKPRGEVLLRGPFNIIGYYKNPEATAEALDADGFFHTGDIAEFDPSDSSLAIVDRRKNMFKLSQGEYIPCELLETQLTSSPYVAQVWIHGESTDNFIVAVVVPSFEALQDCPLLSKEARVLAATAFRKASTGPAAERKEDSEEAWAVCRSAEVNAFIKEQLLSLCAKNQLPHFQYPRAVLLDPVLWTTENNLVTPSFKLKRPFLRERFAAQLAELLPKVRQEVADAEKARAASTGAARVQQ